MARAKEYTFVVASPPSPDLLERMARFLTETLAGYENLDVGGTVRRLADEEVGKCPAVNLSALDLIKEAS